MTRSQIFEQMEQCTKISDNYLTNLINGRTEDLERLYKEALDTFPLKCGEGSFVETDDAIEEIDDEDVKALTAKEIMAISKQMTIYNLMVLSNNLNKDIHLEKCDAFFKEELEFKGVNRRQKLSKDDLEDFLKEVYGTPTSSSKRSLEKEVPQQEEQQQKKPRRLFDEQEDAQVLGEEVVYLEAGDSNFVGEEEIPVEKLVSLDTDFDFASGDEGNGNEDNREEENGEEMVEEDNDESAVNEKDELSDIEEDENNNDDRASHATASHRARRSTARAARPIASPSSDDEDDYEPSAPASSSRAPRSAARSASSSSTVKDPQPQMADNQRREEKKIPGQLTLRKKHEPWTDAEVFALEEGLRELKRPNWVQIIINSGGALIDRTNVQCKDKAKTELNKLARRGLSEKKDLGAWGYVKFPEL